MIELRHGVADIGLITPIYVKGGAHLIRTQSGFYAGADTVEQQVALYHCMAAASPQFEAELHGLKVLAVQGGSLPGVLTRDRPVHTLSDLQGTAPPRTKRIAGRAQGSGGRSREHADG